jgi:hypothetical protein
MSFISNFEEISEKRWYLEVLKRLTKALGYEFVMREVIVSEQPINENRFEFWKEKKIYLIVME